MIYAWRAWRIRGEPVWAARREWQDRFLSASAHGPYVERWVPYLQSITTTTSNLWGTPGPVTATCDMTRLMQSVEPSHVPHDAPGTGCTCGIWGTSTLQQPMEYAHSPWIAAAGNVTIVPPSVIPASWTVTTPTSGAWAALSSGPNPFVVIGVAAFWGRIIPHETGLRAQHAQVVALAEKYGSYHQELSQRYDIPILPTMSALAEEYKLQMAWA